jgi:hypothetical protein
MKVLVACEYSGAVRDAFIRRGHEATSVDIVTSESAFGPHITGDCLDYLGDGWDMLIAFPPCTHLAASGARWWAGKMNEQREALRFVQRLMAAPIARIAIENPIGKISTAIRKPDQIIQPWQFGHGETKTTCLWLKGLPKLTPTNIVSGREARIHRMAPGPNRQKERSRTYAGIAEAMAAQWGTTRQSDVNRSALADGCIAERANSLLPTSTSKAEDA